MKRHKISIILRLLSLITFILLFPTLLNADSLERQNRNYPYHPGWPKSLGEYITDINFADLDNNGTLEILVGTEKEIYAYRENGELIDGWPISLEEYFIEGIAGIAAGDINKDGYIEIAASADKDLYNNSLFLLSRDGKMFPYWPYDYEFPPSFRSVRVPVMTYFDDAKDKRMSGGKVFCAGSYDFPSVHHQKDIFFGADTSAQDVPGFPIEGNYEFSAPLQSHLTVGDIDADGYPELIASKIVVTSGTGYIYIIQHDGAWDTLSSLSQGKEIAVGDLGQDQEPELVTTRHYAGGNDCELTVVDARGNEKPGWPQWIGREYATAPILADIDQDGDVEIIEAFYGYENDINSIYAFHHDGNLVNGWPVQIEATQENCYFSVPIAGNIDGYPGLEIATVSMDGYLYAFHADGTPLDGYPQQIETEPWQSGWNNIYLAKPSLLDIDNDGLTELILYWHNGNIHVFDCDGQYSNKGTWPMFRHNPKRTGFYVPRNFIKQIGESLEESIQKNPQTQKDIR